LLAGAVILALRQWGAWTAQEDITGVTPQELATTLNFQGDADKLWEGLHAANFLVEDQDGRTLLGEYEREILPVIKRAKNAAKYSRDYRERQKLLRVSTDVSTDASANANSKQHDEGHVSLHVSPDVSLHTSKEKKPAPKAAKSEYSLEFEQFWSIYPRTTGMSKVAAYRCWNTCVKTYKAKPEELIASAEHYRQQCVTGRTEEKFMKHPTTWLGPDKHYEPFITGIPGGNTNGTHQQPPATVKRTSGGWSGRLATVKSDTDTGDKPTPATPDEAAGKRDVSILPGVN